MLVLIPPNFPDGQSAEKAAPIANPSKKLCRASPRRIIQATDLNDFIGIAFSDITDKSLSPSLSFCAILYKECTQKVLKTSICQYLKLMQARMLLKLLKSLFL